MEHTFLCTYDAERNETAVIICHADSSLSGKHVCSYEFDSKGNWTKKKESEFAVKSGKLSLKEVMLTYRTITYHPGGRDDKEGERDRNRFPENEARYAGSRGGAEE